MRTQTAPSHVPFKVAFINPNEVGKVWATPLRFSRDFSKDDFETLWDEARQGIVEALESRWDEDYCGQKDFAVGDECGDSWTQCGGVYSARICCPDYVAVVSNALGKTKHREKWAFHLTVEVWDNEERARLGIPGPCGELVIKAGSLFVPRDGFDYSIFYSPNQNPTAQ